MAFINAPRSIDPCAIWPAGPIMGPWTYRTITITQALHPENWQHVLESKALFQCFYRMCTDYLNSCCDYPLPAGAGIEEFVEGERKSWRKAFEAAVKKVQKHKAESIRQVAPFTEKVRMLHCYMGGAAPSGRDIRLTARFKFRYGPTLSTFGIMLDEQVGKEERLSSSSSSSESPSSPSISLSLPAGTDRTLLDGIQQQIQRLPQQPEATEVEMRLRAPQWPTVRPPSPMYSSTMDAKSMMQTTETAAVDTEKETETDQRHLSTEFYGLLAEYHSQPGGLPALEGYGAFDMVTARDVFDGDISNDTDGDELKEEKVDAVIEMWARKSIISSPGRVPVEELVV